MFIFFLLVNLIIKVYQLTSIQQREEEIYRQKKLEAVREAKRINESLARCVIMISKSEHKKFSYGLTYYIYYI